MQTLHLKTNDLVMAKILSFVDSLAKKGDEIEILDESVYLYEKKHIDRSLKEISQGEFYSIDDVERELFNAD